ncbi:hypothetical protein AJ80_05818 [Polytolypa hystricis UAMH7299]|uniref:Uncharacterized protein n=1 Tax=Polytolypa hystricis (strain UAMH7299) TaxID=1447883 RepID=A0A2B7XSM2_POLH7|nr:hypothetical protein AJ80_05818 [Polytolypa hystricis UAMH7299]
MAFLDRPRRRRRPDICEFSQNSELLGCRLNLETVQRWIPGALRLHPPHRASGPLSDVEILQIDLTGAISRSTFHAARCLRARDYIDTFKLLHGALDKADQRRRMHGLTSSSSNTDDTIILSELLENFYAENSHYGNANWTRVLKLFACLGDMLDPSFLHAPRSLCRGLNTFLLRHMRKLATQTPLDVSLQFVALCLEADIEHVLDALIECLPRREREVLFESRGLVPLFFTGAPERRIQIAVERVLERIEMLEGWDDDDYDDEDGFSGGGLRRRGRRRRRRGPGFIDGVSCRPGIGYGMSGPGFAGRGFGIGRGGTVGYGGGRGAGSQVVSYQQPWQMWPPGGRGFY